MVRYLDPDEHPELGEERRRRSSPGERLARARERNAALTGTEAIEAAREVALRKLDARACSRAELTGAIEPAEHDSSTTRLIRLYRRTNCAEDGTCALFE